MVCDLKELHGRFGTIVHRSWQVICLHRLLFWKCFHSLSKSLSLHYPVWMHNDASFIADLAPNTLNLSYLSSRHWNAESQRHTDKLWIGHVTNDAVWLLFLTVWKQLCHSVCFYILGVAFLITVKEYFIPFFSQTFFSVCVCVWVGFRILK